MGICLKSRRIHFKVQIGGDCILAFESIHQMKKRKLQFWWMILYRDYLHVFPLRKNLYTRFDNIVYMKSY